MVNSIGILYPIPGLVTATCEYVWLNSKTDTFTSSLPDQLKEPRLARLNLEETESASKYGIKKSLRELEVFISARPG